MNSQPEEAEDQTAATPEGSWETLLPYAGPFARQDIGIFRPGEVMSDYKAVVEAIGAGRRSAASVQHFFEGIPIAPPPNMIRQDNKILSLDKLEPVSYAPRQKMPERPAAERLNDPAAEIALGYSEEQAREEARRCLQCGLICYRREADGGL